MKFELTQAQLTKAQEWMASLDDQYTGAIGGRFTFSFSITSIGTIIKVTDSVTEKELDLTDYEDW